MIILNKPYVSDFMIETIKRNNYKVLDNEIAEMYFDKTKLLSNKEAVENYKTDKIVYSNSENSIDWVKTHLKDSELYRMITISKDKFKFRQALQHLYPNYYFKQISLKEISSINAKNIKFPVILKPSIGFLSFGVYTVENISQWNEIIKNISADIEKFKNIFPTDVVNTQNFLIEELIQGDEYAIDGYFDKNGKAVILNIFQHPFYNGKDVSDRAYFTSKSIMQKYLSEFENLLNKISKAVDYKNFPFHLELRVHNSEIIPIELNPMRCCGWCITDIADYAWGINVYEYITQNQIPDWNSILKSADNDYYYFTIADIPQNTDKTLIDKMDMDSYLKNISHPLDIRLIDYTKNPIFAIIFAKTESYDEIKNILGLDMTKYIKVIEKKY